MNRRNLLASIAMALAPKPSLEAPCALPPVEQLDDSPYVTQQDDPLAQAYESDLEHARRRPGRLLTVNRLP